MVRLRTLFCATLVFLCTHALSPVRGNGWEMPPSPPPLNKFGKKIPVPEGEFLNLICECLREDPVKGNCPEVGYTERNSDGDIYGVLSHWDTSEITDMSNAFSGERLTTNVGWASCDPVLPSEVKESFNPDFSLWNTSSVTGFPQTFKDQSAFWGTGLKFWSVSHAEDFGEMFKGCASFVEPISFWNVEKAGDMRGMFSGCSKFNADISLWKTDLNEDMAHMFSGCTKFNSNLASWDVSNVKDMEGLFAGASTFNKPIGYWDTSSVTKMSHMFENAESFNQDVSKWGVESDTDFENMFAGALAFNRKWTCETEASGPPDTCELKEPYFFNALGNKMFDSRSDLCSAVCDCLTEEPIRGICTEYARESEYGILPYWDVSRLKDFKGTFSALRILGISDGESFGGESCPSCSGVTEQSLSRFNADFSYWNMEKAEDIRGMFRGLPKFEGKGLKFWDVSSVEDMRRMFDSCDEFNEPIGLWDTSSVADMRYMFNNAGEFTADISKWNVEHVTSMRAMFENAKKFKADIGATWSGSAASRRQNDIFLGADAFNELYECETPTNGPVSSCEKVRPPSPWRCD